MKLMKKSIILTLILFLIFGIFNNVYAVSSCSIVLETPENRISAGEEFIVNVKIANIIDDNGILVAGGEINYNKDDLTLLRLEAGDSAWTEPAYYSETGRFVIDREDFGKTDEILFKIVFKINNENVSNSGISLTNLSVTNGEYDIQVKDTNIFVGTTTAITTPEPTPNTSPTTESTKKSGIISSLLSKIGTSSNLKVLIFVLILLIVIVLIYYKIIKKINKKTKH